MNQAGKNADIDVAIVGAGAAGIAAARYLRAKTLDCRVLEARARPGGRAWTDHDSLGLPFDRGCAWLHDALHNPLRLLARSEGMECASGMHIRYHRGGRFAARRESEAIRDFLDRSIQTLTCTGRTGHDVPAASILPRTDAHKPFLDYLVAAINGVDAESYSTGDAAEEESGENWIIREGLGTLIAERLGAKLPMSLDCPVRRIAWNGRGVRLDTDQGSLRARAVIVTVSTGVLAGGGLAFEPGLPDWKRRALDALPMGRAEKIALAFDGDVFDVPENTLVSIERQGRVVGFHLRPFGHALAVCYTGGQLAETVAGMEQAETQAFAMDHLAHAFGAGIRRRLHGCSITAWHKDPWARGSYSAAQPGGHLQRALLARPLSPYLQFAGEATHSQAFATAHGAWMSGIRAAESVAAALTG